MSLPVYPVLGVHIAQLVNIPRNIATGYQQIHSGKLTYPNGSFMCYGSISVLGSDGNAINNSAEADANWSIMFNQLPSDSKGNILMTNYCMSRYQASSGNYMRLFIFCSKEPTHKLVLATGEIINDDSDNDYLREMVFSYTLVNI